MDRSKFNQKSEWRKFAIGLAVILFIIATIQLFLGKNIYLYFYISSVVVLLIGLVVPIVIKPVYILFSFVGFGIGWVMTKILLMLLFYLVFTPISFILKIFNKHLLDLQFDREEESYWITKDVGASSTIDKMY